MIIGEIPDWETLEQLFSLKGCWKNMPESIHERYAGTLAEKGFAVIEDRDNFDYVYLRTDLAELPGKQLHKKRNLVNAFTSAYSVEVKPLDVTTRGDAAYVLEAWTSVRIEDVGDYVQCSRALYNLDVFGLKGWIVYADGIPAGWSLGEEIAGREMFCVHYEKGIDTYKGIYQYVNMITAASLPEDIQFMNREQDLGNPGLRQAKLTYRPCRFVKKYKVIHEQPCSDQDIIPA
jgi:hypothetical protein